MSLINNIMLLNCWIHCNTNLCAGVRMCLVCCSRWWVIGWRGEYTVRATDVSLGASYISTLMIHCESGCGAGWRAVKFWRRQTGRDSCYCMQEALLSWIIYTVFLAEADSSWNGDEIPCRLCNLKVTLFCVSWIQSKQSCTVSARRWWKILRDVS